MLGNAVKPTHILIVLIIVLLLFGAKRLPDLAKSVGQSLKIFKSEIKDLTDDKDDTPAAPVAVAPVVVPPVAPVAQPVAPPVAPAPAPAVSATEVPAPAPAAGSDQPTS